MPTTIEVTAEDIAQGRPGDPDACAIALAFRRVPGFENADVATKAVWFGSDRRELPAGAVEFIRQFDNGSPVEPFTFTID